MFVNKHFTYLPCASQIAKGVIIEIFGISMFYEDKDICRFLNLYQCTFNIKKFSKVKFGEDLLSGMRSDFGESSIVG